jgi:tetratricopeptide (TPR) repeat protein
MQKADSFELALSYAENLDDRFAILLKLSNELDDIDPAKALKYAKQAHQFSKESQNQNDLLNAMLAMARNYWSLTNYDSSMQYAVKSEELSEKLDLPLELLQSHYIIGIIYYELDELDKSVKYFFSSLRLSEQIKDRKREGKCLNGIGSINFKQLNYTKALEYYSKSLNIAKEINDSIGIAGRLNNIAAVYLVMENYNKALDYIEKALALNKVLMNKKLEGINYLNLGEIYFSLQNYDAVYENLQKALIIFESLNNTLFIAECHLNLGNYFLITNDAKQSKEYATKAFEEGKEYAYLAVVQKSAELLSRIYLAKSDTLNSLKYEVIKHQMNDSLNIRKSNTELTKIELKYELNKQEQEKKIDQQRKDFIMLIVLISLTLGLIVIMLVFARQKIKAKNVQLEKEKVEIELDSRNKELASNAMYLLKKNEMLSDILDNLAQLEENTVKQENRSAVQKIAKEMLKFKDQDIWKDFEIRFNQVHIDFYKRLSHTYPELTSNDLRLCAFLKLNMTTKEISQITGQRVGTIEMARSRLRKKFGISKTQMDLVTFLTNV